MKAIFVSMEFEKPVVMDIERAKLAFILKGYTEDHTKLREQGVGHSPLLDNQPVFEGWVGPMLDGDKLRYETQEVYNMLSV